MTKSLKIYSRRLPDRSNLRFEFPSEDGDPKRLNIPMMQNCEISESKRANLQEYNLLGRNSTLYSYGGGTSRQFNVRFSITLPHVFDMLSRDPLPSKFKAQYSHYNKSLIKSTIDDYGLVTEFNGVLEERSIRGYADKNKDYYDELTGKKAPQRTLFDTIVNGIAGGFNINDFVPDPANASKKSLEAINLIMFWVNVIRVGCVNNSSNTTLGPPIIRLNHGVMYNNIPCVMENYNISIDQSAGMDINTLLGKVVNIQLSLNEVRIGNFGTFKPFSQVGSDNNYGWEAIFDHGTIDPYTQDGMR